MVDVGRARACWSGSWSAFRSPWCAPAVTAVCVDATRWPRALGVPVLGSVEARRQGPPRLDRRCSEIYDPSSVDVWNLRRVLHRLALGDAAEGFRDPGACRSPPTPPRWRPARSSPCSPRAWVSGQTLVPADDEALAPLRAACCPPVPDHPEQLPSSPRRFGADRSGGQVTVAMVAVDAAQPQTRRVAGRVVLAVSSGFALGRRPGPIGAGCGGFRVTPSTGSSSSTPTRATPRPVSGPDPSCPGRTRPGRPPALRALSSRIEAGSPFMAQRQMATATGPSAGTRRANRARSSACVSWPLSARRTGVPLCAVALMGLVLGASFHLVVPRKYAATTSLYLTEPAASGPGPGDGQRREPPADPSRGRARHRSSPSSATPGELPRFVPGVVAQQRHPADHRER